jgi:hypothetical protein
MQLLDYDDNDGTMTLYLTTREYYDFADVVTGVHSLFYMQSPEILGVTEEEIAPLSESLSALPRRVVRERGKENLTEPPGREDILLVQDSPEDGTKTIILRRNDFKKILSILHGVYKTLDDQDTTVLETNEETLRNIIAKLEDVEKDIALLRV